MRSHRDYPWVVSPRWPARRRHSGCRQQGRVTLLVQLECLTHLREIVPFVIYARDRREGCRVAEEALDDVGRCALPFGELAAERAPQIVDAIVGDATQLIE